MISTDLQRVQIQDIIEYQLPAFVRDDFPLVGEFLKQYYISQEFPTSPADVIQNIDEYVKLETLLSAEDEARLDLDIEFDDTTINATFNLYEDYFGTYKFPERYGLIKIDDEIILYTTRSNYQFKGCVRGFSGITQFNDSDQELNFSSSEATSHVQGAKIINLSNLLLKEFLVKLKQQISPGFERRELDSELNQRLFLSRSRDFYQSKGTDESFKILFGALYGEKAEVIKPKEFLFRPSDAQYRKTRDLVVEAIVGDPSSLKNQTLYQDAYPEYGIESSYGTVVDVQRLLRDDKNYYQLSVDFDYSKDIDLTGGTVLGNFVSHPKTKNTTVVASGSSIIDVDSTIGFPDKGQLIIDGQSGILTYRSKTINQFFGVGLANTTVSGTTADISAGTEFNLNVNAYGFQGYNSISIASSETSTVGIATTTKIEVRIGNVLSNNLIYDDTSYFTTNDNIRIKSLGITTYSPLNINWLTNVSPKYDVKEVTLTDSSSFTYSIETFAANSFTVGDSVTVIQSDGVGKSGLVIDISNAKKFSFSRAGELTGSTFSVRRDILKPEVNKVNDKNYSYLSKSFANIQNTYAKYTGDVLVASPSIPNYFDTPLNFYDKKIELDGTYSGEVFSSTQDHGYYTGDKIYYESYRYTDSIGLTVESRFPEIEPGVFYVKRVSSTQFKIASSITNLYNNTFVSVSGIVTSNYFCASDFFDKRLEHQQLFREFKSPINDGGDYNTLPGKTGMFVNGVELLNYKSGDSVYFGKINEITVSAGGDDYDVVNPPVLSIQDSTGIGATGIVNVKGTFKKFEIIDPGFDYVTDPIITITGGNGSGAIAAASTKFITHSVSFYATSDNPQVGLSSNSIGFTTFHKLRESEKVIYRSDGQTEIGGLSPNAEYFVKLIDSKTIKLFKTESDTISGSNAVDLTSNGVGVHRIESFNQKRVISDINIINPGSDYENKQRSVDFSGINTASNQINIPDHRFNSGETVTYSGNASGLSSDQTYIVTVVDSDNFKLSSVGVGTTSKLYYYNSRQYVNIESTGSDSHTFNYPPISVVVEGQIGVTTFTGQDFNAKIQPIVRGSVESVQLTDKGVGYGSSEIINHNKQPLFKLLTGRDAELLPIVNNGKIEQVLVTNNGYEYNTPPTLTINGTGRFAKLTPIVSNGQITNIIVDNSGTDYDDTTTITVTPSGLGANLIAQINQWTVNLFEKNKEIIESDDGILDVALNDEYGIQFTHLYAPRKLRESLYGKSLTGTSQFEADLIYDNIKYGVGDLRIDGSNKEVTNEFHSPILGWAYDGNPIYGPYGYENNTGGNVKALRSGYSLIDASNRPSISTWKKGFFVQDFEFTNDGDLDEHNGRYCVTPDFPNGVYAYFATISDGSVESDGAFKNNKIPEFPYVIGNNFKSKPNDFNFKNDSYQNNYDVAANRWLRNTTFYGLTLDNATYEFVTQPYEIFQEVIDITATSKGSIDSVGIITGGSGYQVNDRIVFEDIPGATPAKAKISRVTGKSVTNISVASSIVSNLEIAPVDSSGRFVAFSTTPHKFVNTDLITLSGFNTSINLNNKSVTIGVTTDFYNLSTGINTSGSTGIVTFISLSGGVIDRGILSIKENDILSLGSEKVKVLNVDNLNSRIRVERAVNGTVSSAHTSTTSISEQSRKFTFNSDRENKVNFELNKQIYFDPRETLGIGTLSGVGIGSTIFFSNPGAGLTQTFLNTRSLFLPNHKLNTGDIVLYHNGDGQSIEVDSNPTTGTTYRIANETKLYVAKISDDIIGIQTFKVGIGSTGTFVGVADTTMNSGLLFFTGIGTGTKHSIKTVRSNVVNAESSKNIVTVATGSTHGLTIGDHVLMSVTPGITTTVTVKYNDHNRRIVFNPIGFTTTGVSTALNTITASDHGLNTGDKVILDSSPAPSGLQDQKIYYVYRFSKDKVRLCNSKFEAEKFQPNFVSIDVARSGTLLPINPSVNIFAGNTVVFDLSDSTLSSLNISTLYSAFEMDLYRDSKYTDKYVGSLTTDDFEVTKTGKVGIDANAKLTLVVNDKTPENLFYKFSLVNSDFVEDVKKEIIIDDEVVGFNKINLVSSDYDGEFTLVGIGTTNTFTYNVKNVPERSSYSSSTGGLSYSTNSTNAYGGISEINITFKGSNYDEVVGVSTVVGIVTGTGAVLEPASTSIGRVLGTNIENIGFNYPTDFTIRPTTNLPEIVQLESLTSFKSIGITSGGRNYAIAPNLIVLDGLTGKHIDDVDLRFELGDSEVTIRKNTSGLTNVTPTIIPISNSNGVSINEITFDMSTKNVTVGFDTGFSDQSPFAVGDKVLIENVSVGVGSTGSGYNSVDYGYQLFTLTDVNIPLGGNVGVVTFSLSGIINDNLYPGNFDSSNSAGKIVNQSSFPQFKIELKKNDFLIGEDVVSNSGTGKVDSWNNRIELLKVSTSRDFKVGDLIIGQTSRTQGRVKSKIDYNSEIETESSSIVERGWRTTTGFFNNNQQRIPDNFYYQNFSYAIKSKIPLQKWDDAVSSLNHTSGFLKFSDLVIESSDDKGTGVVFTDNSANVSLTVDLMPIPTYGGGGAGFGGFGGAISLNCFPAFDLVTENDKFASGKIYSDRIFLQNRVLTDFFESVGNRVLIIDDISTQFNSEERPTRFSVVKKFSIDQRSKKILTFVRDKLYTGERQASLVTLVHDNQNATVNNYGRVESVLDLGSFDFNISGTEGQLLFFPTKFRRNNYNISLCSFDIDDSVTGVGTFALGEICDISSTQVEVPAATKTTIVGIASTYRSSKVLVQFTTDDGRFGYNELNVIHDGTTVDVLEYGDLITGGQGTATGLGTYGADMSAGTINVDFTPAAGLALTANTVRVSMSSTESVGVGTTIIGQSTENIARLETFHTSIGSTSSPGIHTIATYTNTSGDTDYSAAYYIVSIEDTTNDQYQMSEVIVLNDASESYITEYGTLETSSGIGTIGALFTSDNTHLQYTPPASANVQVRVYQQAVQLVDVDNTLDNEIDINNASITAGFGFYEGTANDVKRQFSLTHKGLPIFNRNFDGSDSTITNITDNEITLPDHFFVTGEPLNYSVGIDTHVRIAIEPTSFTGIGTTSLLPINATVFAIKQNDSKIKLASSAENANNSTPVAIGITGVGIGTFHTFTSTKQNTKCLIAIDNIIQNPIVSTATTTSLDKEIQIGDAVIETVGVTSFFSADLIQVESEIMKINTVGLGTTNGILVDRGWMGTGITTHPVGVAVTKVDGAYNIVGNTINFYTAPRGPIPIGSITNPPDERDWTGITTFSKFQGRAFTRSQTQNSSEPAYESNYVFDSIADQFDATTKTFTLKSENENVTGFSTNNGVVLINGIFQGPTGQLSIPQDYSLSEGSGISSITFTGTATSIAYDPNNANIPVGGYIVSVGSTGGLGYQPLVAAGGTAIVSSAGTITSISIGNTGSGYRSGIQTVNVGVYTSSTGRTGIEFIGTAAISNGHIVSVAITNPGSGYLIGSEPNVVFDAPRSYSDIPLIYSDSSSAGFGTEATVNIVVGQGSSVIDFEIKNFGYRYGQKQILTVATGGATGIPTDTNFTFEEFQITVDKTDSDKFSAWHFGELERLDNINTEFDGVTRQFTIKRNGDPVTVRAAKGSNIDVESTLIIFVNDILQVPGEAYQFSGGSVINFSEAPKGPSADGNFSGDTCKILFYKGSGDIDVTFRDILPTIKDGDMLSIRGDDSLVPGSLDQNERLVTEVLSSDTVETNAYYGRGIDSNPDHARTVTWCKQTSDKVINGKIVSKARELNAALINPRTNIIQSVGVGSTEIYVESVIPFFNPDDENQTVKNQQTISIVSQDNLVAAAATAVVSIANTVESITIGYGGTGYVTAPSVTIETPVGLGTTARATATATLTGDAVSAITVSTPGVGYTRTSVPQVLIESPKLIKETNRSSLYQGDFGDIVGLTSTSVGVASTGFVMDMFIPIDSFLRDTKVVGAAVTLSDISVGDYFTVRNSNVGSGVTTLYQTGGTLGVTTQFIDSVYEVAAVSVAQTAVAGVGITYIKRVTVSVEDLGDITGIGLTEFYGEFSWGKITLGSRVNAVAFDAYTLRGSAGITTGAVINRVEPLKLVGYSTT